MSNSLAIQTMDGEHIGFVLMHFDSDTSSAGNYNGECVFMALPMNIELLNHPLTDRMYEHKFAGEHSCRLSVTETGDEYFIIKEGVKPLRIILTREKGIFFDDLSNSPIGRVFRAKP